MSLRIIPSDSRESKVSSTHFNDASKNTPSLSEKLHTQSGPVNISSKINNLHPLQSRVNNWEHTQQDTRLETYRRIFGAGEPIKRTMELSIVENTDFKPQVLGGSDPMHRDVLLGKDTSLDWEDVYPNGLSQNGNNVMDMHSEMEKRLGL
ncbi:Proteasome maturation factor UMP1 family protein [Candida parapsilosis]|uniref:Proteasome maturation factor UMP1 family protein n=1 Tax=Candida parapsilosis TaxID=5480 RepID=A0A8X7NJQ0_CANPA|nr:Proteasome maturation factor UMP1 family protein [Candida parapsilosis]KAF6045108.1 Proteasome maturation factor UMP1 family protein [Candida parapsilosis]KAF6048747.1 Proteasome maturation factor UMP1 family protein [Candida parapsilosis]KAF6060748.1 Proteasome maturation factor UMP1 family protein [Candida parapsilosis]KAI5900977.1 Proteasome maturation factor UMP1 [Candida parapsilosis]